MGVINSTQSRNLCNAWNMCISVPFIISKHRRKKNHQAVILILIQVTDLPEVQGTVVVPQHLHSKGTSVNQAHLLETHLTHLQSSCWHRRALRDLMVQMGITARVEPRYSRRPWLHQCTSWQPATGKFTWAAAHLVCSTDTLFLNAVCWTTTIPDERNQCQKGFQKATLQYVIILLSTLSENHRASGTARSHCSKCCTNAEIPQTGRYPYSSEQWGDRKTSCQRKKKAKSPVDSKWTTCQCSKPCASQAFWV